MKVRTGWMATCLVAVAAMGFAQESEESEGVEEAMQEVSAAVQDKAVPVPATQPVESAKEAEKRESDGYSAMLDKFLAASDENPEVIFHICRNVSAETLRRLLENFLTPAGTVSRSDEEDMIVVSDVPSRLPQIKQILEAADRPVPQVLVEARIVEVEVSDGLDKDIELGFANMGNEAALADVAKSLFVPGFSAAPESSMGAGGSKASTGRLWTYLGNEDAKMWGLINFLASKGRARLLSSPNLAIRRGADGNIMTGEKVPISTLTWNGNTSSESYRFENVGVKLIVRPVMINGSRIRVRVSPEVSNITREYIGQNGSRVPYIGVRSATTELEANAGEMVVIGGLLRDELRTTERRVPYLASIPLLGWFFRSDKNETITSQLVIFLTMRLIEPGNPGQYEALQSGKVPTEIRERVQIIEQQILEENATSKKGLKP